MKRNLAKCIMPLPIRSFGGGRDVIDWCEAVGLQIEYLINCINGASKYWNDVFRAGTGISNLYVLDEDVTFTWTNQPEKQWTIPTYIKLSQGDAWGGSTSQHMAHHISECTHATILIWGNDCDAVWMKPDGINEFRITKEKRQLSLWKHEFGHILGLTHIKGAEFQDNIMHSGNRDRNPAEVIGEQDKDLLREQYPIWFGVEPIYKPYHPPDLYYRVNP